MLPVLWREQPSPAPSPGEARGQALPARDPASPGEAEATTCGQPCCCLCLSAHLPRPRLGCLTPARARQEEKPRTAGKSSSSTFQRQKETNFGFRSCGKNCLSAIYVARFSYVQSYKRICVGFMGLMFLLPFESTAASKKSTPY